MIDVPLEIWMQIINYANNYENYKSLRAVCWEFYDICELNPPASFGRTPIGRLHGSYVIVQDCNLGCCVDKTCIQVATYRNGKLNKLVEIHDSPNWFIITRSNQPRLAEHWCIKSRNDDNTVVDSELVNLLPDNKFGFKIIEMSIINLNEDYTSKIYQEPNSFQEFVWSKFGKSFWD